MRCRCRLGAFIKPGQSRAQERGIGLTLLLTLIAAAVATGLLGPVRRATTRLGQRYLVNDAPGHRLRRSAYALWMTFVSTVLPIVAATVVAVPIGWATAPAWSGIVSAFILSAGSAAFTAAVLSALLMRNQPCEVVPVFWTGG